MAYAIRYRSTAKAEMEESCDCYGETYRREIQIWLRRIAEAESGDASIAIDITAVLAEGLDTYGSSWKHSWREWWLKAPRERVLAVYHVFRKW